MKHQGDIAPYIKSPSNKTILQKEGSHIKKHDLTTRVGDPQKNTKTGTNFPNTQLYKISQKRLVNQDMGSSSP